MLVVTRNRTQGHCLHSLNWAMTTRQLSALHNHYLSLLCVWCLVWFVLSSTSCLLLVTLFTLTTKPNKQRWIVWNKKHQIVRESICLFSLSYFKTCLSWKDNYVTIYISSVLYPIRIHSTCIHYIYYIYIVLCTHVLYTCSWHTRLGFNMLVFVFNCIWKTSYTLKILFSQLGFVILSTYV